MSLPEGFQPMKAIEINYEKTVFPYIASPKIDGFRCLIWNGKAYTRSGKLVRNAHFQASVALQKGRWDGCDGEIVAGSPTDPFAISNTSKTLTRVDAVVDFNYYVFDRMDPCFAEHPYEHRLAMVPKGLRLESRWVRNIDELYEARAHYLDLGYEGIMLRSPHGPYKYGRSSVKENYLLKVKDFLDAEAPIVGFGEHEHNANEATQDEFGYTKRSSHKANKHGTGKLGKLICQWTNGMTFKIGTGFTDAQRKEIWENRDEYLGKLAKFKYQPCGTKDVPRTPVFIDFRDADDL